MKYIISKRIRTLIIILISSSIIFVPSIAIAENLSSSSKSSSSSNSQSSSTTAQHLANIKSRGDIEINRRLAQLEKLSSLISASTKLTSTDKSTLTTEVTTEITGLTTLETKLNGETTISAAATDIQSIYSEYRVYALVTPKIWLIKTADDQQAVEAKLTTIAGKLQTRITNEATDGKTVTVMQTALNDMTTNVTNSQQISSLIESAVLPLQPSDYNSDHTILSGDAAKLKMAHDDNVTAYNDAKTIITDLENL